MTTFDPVTYKETTERQWQEAAERGTAGGRRLANGWVRRPRRCSAWLTDISSNILQFAAAEARRHGLANVECLRMDGEHLDVPAASFDAVICRVGLI